MVNEGVLVVCPRCKTTRVESYGIGIWKCLEDSTIFDRNNKIYTIGYVIEKW